MRKRVASLLDERAAAYAEMDLLKRELHAREVEVLNATQAREEAEVTRARFTTGGRYRLLASANFGELVLGRIEVSNQARKHVRSFSSKSDFCKQILVGIRNSEDNRNTEILRTIAKNIDKGSI